MDRSLLAQEAAEAPERVAAMLAANAAQVAEIAARLRRAPPRMVVTCARGSSDHAAACIRFAVQRHLGIPAFDLAPSMASVYGARLDLSGALFLAVSQSGQSPDLVRAASWAREAGALALAVVNSPQSDLARASDGVIDIAAGPEASVAATKSYIASVAAGLQLVAAAGDTAELRHAVESLPEVLGRAAALDWSALMPALAPADSAYVAGRGPGFGIVQEMALKMKECCVLHAEAVSAAEIMHGPFQMLRGGLPVLAIGQGDESAESLRAMLARVAGQGVAMLVAMPGYEGPGALPVVEGAAPLVAPLAALQSFYGAVGALAEARGHDPDRPALLAKVTETL